MQNLFGILRVSSLKGRLRLLFSVLVMAMCLLVVLYMALFGKVIKEREIHAALQEAIDLQRLFIDKWKSERLADVHYMALTSAARSLNLQEMGSQFRLFQSSHTDFNTISFANADGKLVLSMTEALDTDVSDRDYFRAARNNEAFVTDVMTGRVSGKSMLAFTAPVRDRNELFAGVLIGTVDLSSLDAFVNEFRFGESGETFLLNKEGYRITRKRDASGALQTEEPYRTEIYERAVAGTQDWKSYLNRDGNRVFGAYAWSADRQWLLVGETRMRDTFKPYYRLLAAILLISGLTLLASYVATMLFTRKISVLLKHLLDGTKRIREGRYGHRIDPALIRSAPAELKELSDNFNIMSDKLQSTVQLLEESAVVDHLTEVYNRRFLMNEGAKIEEAAARAGNPSCILLVDVDYFKQINDTYGHLVGDRVLKHAAALLVASVRNSDVAARYGGEEFVILATNCELARGKELAERIRTWFMNSPYRDEEREIVITVSIGVAQSSPQRTYGTNTLEDMIERADRALYRAKHLGRNRVECDDNLWKRKSE
ncbi:diguanylate cyclase [Paenibacillus mesophilus]|uniref:sensor domain-containing diguanylate cyclase n=1 Tax=Paenibacillus mesophilus TaxID=2582849 RepID=UPI00110EFEEF|nr:diguanylate cyclase [Paenibacillus mesophilus]TMV49452.1 diguanylate cyclase [Paenibacillus mesophilus]